MLVNDRRPATPVKPAYSGAARVTMRRALVAAIWTVPAVVMVLLIGGAWASGVLLSDLLVPNLAWVIATSGGIGALLATRRSANAIGWLLWLIGIVIGLSMVSVLYLGVVGESGDPSDLPGAVLIGWFNTWSTTTVLVMAVLFLPLLFPDGRPPTRAWRPVVVVSVVVTVADTLHAMIRPGPMLDGSPMANPFGVSDGPLQQLLGLFDVATPAAAIVALLALVQRYRHGHVIERQQLRWFAASMAVTAIGLAILITVPEEYGTIGFGVLIFSLGLIPIAIGIAITRYRLYEIDRIISRTVAWLLLSAILAAVFVVAVIGLQSFLTPLTEGSTLAVAGSTLVVFALFQPLRGRVQRAVDRRFNRTRVDAEQTVRAFGNRVRDDVDLGAVQHRLVGAVDESMRPASIGMWLRSGGDRA